ncbi:MAG: hypothetical protein WD266_09355 [Balneolales bacterium]
MQVFSRVIREITPPIILKTFHNFSWQVSDHNDDLLNMDQATIDIQSVQPSTLACFIGQPVFLLPVNSLRYWGGIPYNYTAHHFMQYYKDGLPALIRYYETHHPENLFEEHFLPTPVRLESIANEQLGSWLSNVPWLYKEIPEVQNGEKGLSTKDGNQAYGPVSDQKITLEAKRLDSILYSIQINGFKPLEFDGYPRGYFLMDDEDSWVFLIREGFHRIAALAHLGYTQIPVRFKPLYPRVIRQTDSGEWPMVKLGYLQEDEALDIFMQYVRATAGLSSYPVLKD